MMAGNASEGSTPYPAVMLLPKNTMVFCSPVVGVSFFAFELESASCSSFPFVFVLSWQLKMENNDKPIVIMNSVVRSIAKIILKLIVSIYQYLIKLFLG